MSLFVLEYIRSERTPRCKWGAWVGPTQCWKNEREKEQNTTDAKSRTKNNNNNPKQSKGKSEEYNEIEEENTNKKETTNTPWLMCARLTCFRLAHQAYTTRFITTKSTSILTTATTPA